MITVIIGLIVSAIIFAAIYKIYSDKKKGKSLCGGKCSCCPNCCACKGSKK
ncbi:MAG: FeoB-associated Cys-rich membrane protein [Oscillospiraceae bacterium]